MYIYTYFHRCWSYKGRIGDSSQPVNLDPRCLSKVMLVIVFEQDNFVKQTVRFDFILYYKKTLLKLLKFYRNKRYKQSGCLILF